MKTTDSVMRELREKYEIDLSNCGLNADNVDYDKLAEARDNFDKELSHSLAEARREERTRIGMVFETSILWDENEDITEWHRNLCKNMREALTGDNPERK